MPRRKQQRLLALDLSRELFITAKQADRCTPRTIAKYRWTLDRFCAWLTAQHVTDASAVNAHLVRRYLGELAEAGQTSWSVRTHAQVIRTWLRFLYTDGLLDADPTANMSMPKLDEHILPAFSTADVERLLKACASERDTALVLFLLDTGCRAAELCGLTVADVDRNDGGVTIRRGKRRKDRYVFLGNRARRAMLRYLGATPAPGPLFPNRHGHPLTPSGLLQWCKRLGERAGVEHCHPHTFRRTFALWSLSVGMDVVTLARLMGHSKLDMLQRYTAQLREHLAAKHAEHGAVDGML